MAVALAGGLLIGAAVVNSKRPTSERFVQVNGFGEWRGFEMAEDSVRWVWSCGQGHALQWEERPGYVEDSLTGFVRQSRLIFTHPSLGAFARVDDFTQPQIDLVTLDMRLFLKEWNASPVKGEKFQGCPSA